MGWALGSEVWAVGYGLWAVGYGLWAVGYAHTENLVRILALYASGSVRRSSSLAALSALI